ncbi:hypothetical protein NSQ95_16850 [Psychrobacillus sp. FSL W7-1457]
MLNGDNRVQFNMYVWDINNDRWNGTMEGKGFIDTFLIVCRRIAWYDC